MNPEKKSFSALYFLIIRTAFIPSHYCPDNFFTKLINLKLKNIINYI